MMTSFIPKKKELEASAILDPPFRITILLKTHINRGMFKRKLDLSIKGCLGSKKTVKCAIPRELSTVEN